MVLGRSYQMQRWYNVLYSLYKAKKFHIANCLTGMDQTRHHHVLRRLVCELCAFCFCRIWRHPCYRTMEPLFCGPVFFYNTPANDRLCWQELRIVCLVLDKLWPESYFSTLKVRAYSSYLKMLVVVQGIPYLARVFPTWPACSMVLGSGSVKWVSSLGVSWSFS